MQNPFDNGYYGSEELRGFGFAHVGENVRIAKTCKIVGLENIAIGDNSRIDDFCTLIGTGPLEIGNRVHIHSYCQLGARGGITMDDYSALAAGCLVFSASDSPLGRHMVGGAVPGYCTNPRNAPVRLGRHSGAFARCTVLPGVSFGEGAMACAHSLVSADVPEWTIVAGAPARHRLDRSRRLLALEPDLPGDYEAQAGQDPISLHSEEHLVTSDKGIGMQRRMLRRAMETVAEGGDPPGVGFDEGVVAKVPGGNFFAG